MINSTHITWILGILAFISVATFFGYQTNKDLVKIHTEHCMALQTAMAQYPHSNADEQFELDGCEEVLYRNLEADGKVLVEAEISAEGCWCSLFDRSGCYEIMCPNWKYTRALLDNE